MMISARTLEKIKLNVGCGEDFWGDVRLDIRKTGASNIIAAAEHLPFKDDSFEATRAYQLLEHLENWREAIKEICRVTRDKLDITVPINSDLAKTDWILLFFPVPKNIKALRELPKRRKEHIWQFKKGDIDDAISREGFKGKVTTIRRNIWNKFIPSRCYRVVGIRS